MLTMYVTQMAISIPSDKVKELMETMRVRQKEDKRLREEAARIAQEVEDKKMYQLLIEAEANMRLEIENYDEATIGEIKRKIKCYPNMCILELCQLFQGYQYCTSDTNLNNLIQIKKNELYYEFISQLVREINEEPASSQKRCHQMIWKTHPKLWMLRIH